jgi:hypothetical protein
MFRELSKESGRGFATLRMHKLLNITVVNNPTNNIITEDMYMYNSHFEQHEVIFVEKCTLIQHLRNYF